MSRPIAVTPALNYKQTKQFLKKVARELNNPTGAIPVSNIDKAIELVMSDARKKLRLED